MFLCIEPPTKAMYKEAADAGFYTSPMNTQHPRIQILTVDDLLDGKKLDMPAWENKMGARTFSSAGVRHGGVDVSFARGKAD